MLSLNEFKASVKAGDEQIRSKYFCDISKEEWEFKKQFLFKQFYDSLNIHTKQTGIFAIHIFGRVVQFKDFYNAVDNKYYMLFISKDLLTNTKGFDIKFNYKSENRHGIFYECMKREIGEQCLWNI